MSRCMSQILAAALAAIFAFSPNNLTGAWTGEIKVQNPDGTSNTTPAYIELKQEGSGITGKVGPSSDSVHPIENATLDHNRLTFSTHYTAPDSQEVVRWTFKLRVIGDEMTGTAQGERSNDTWNVEINVTRRKMAMRFRPSGIVPTLRTAGFQQRRGGTHSIAEARRTAQAGGIAFLTSSLPKQPQSSPAHLGHAHRSPRLVNGSSAAASPEQHR